MAYKFISFSSLKLNAPGIRQGGGWGARGGCEK